jgi:hypothetical protein
MSLPELRLRGIVAILSWPFMLALITASSAFVAAIATRLDWTLSEPLRTVLFFAVLIVCSLAAISCPGPGFLSAGRCGPDATACARASWDSD